MTYRGAQLVKGFVGEDQYLEVDPGGRQEANGGFLGLG